MTKVEEYISQLPRSHRENAIMLRNIVLQSSPEIKESFKYSCPFYDCKKNLCYFYLSKDRLILGFVQGEKLSLSNSLLVGKQKHVRHVFIEKIDENFENKLRYLLQEAILLNEELYRTNKNQWN